MLDDMNMRRFTLDTQTRLRSCCQEACSFLGRSPDIRDRRRLRAFQLHLTEIRVSRHHQQRP